MPKYWGKQIFARGRFPEVGEKEKTQEKKREKKDQKLVITMTTCLNFTLVQAQTWNNAQARKQCLCTFYVFGVKFKDVLAFYIEKA